MSEKAFRAQRCLAAALLVMLLLAGSSPAAAVAGVTAKPAAPSAHAPTGKLTSILIVAQDVVSDPNFAGSIVLVMNDLGPAPVGLIINRPMPLSVARFFPQLKRLAGVRDRVYYGGPVEFGTGTVWYLFRAGSAPATAIQVCAGVYVSSSRKLLLKLLARRHPLQGLRIFVGYAGWAPGQLQAEIQGGAWAPRRADAASIFHPEPLRPWPSAQGQGPGGGT